MNQVIGDILPFAVAVALSPLPIIAAILTLLSPHPRGRSLGFLLGWIVGVILAVAVFILIGSLIPVGNEDEPAPVLAAVQIILGSLILALAVGQWRKRSRAGEEPDIPKWMTAIDTMKPVASLGLGLALAALNPKNLMMAAAAGVAIGAAGLTTGEQVIAAAVFTLVAVSSIAIPVLAYLAAAKHLKAPLEALRTWLLANNATIMAVLLLVIGFTVIGKGIGSL
jgi:threonine/homoserine/homoserine lactone efflux protein